MTTDDPDTNRISLMPIFQNFTFSKSQILKGLKNMSIVGWLDAKIQKNLMAGSMRTFTDKADYIGPEAGPKSCWVM